MSAAIAAVVAGAMVLAAAGAAAAADKAPRDRVLILLADNFNKTEYYVPMLALKSVGYKIDVAGIKKGKVWLSGPDKPSPQDVEANLALEDVGDPAQWAALVIPGGYSPGNLEKHARSLEICRAFVKANVPVGAICHGPRLLMRAGLMKNRVGTCLYSVANELCDAWKTREYGCWFDRPVLSDGPIITAPHYDYIGAFCRALGTRLEAEGGLPVPKCDANAVVIAPGLAQGHEKWATGNVPREMGRVKTTVLLTAADVKKYVDAPAHNPQGVDAVVILAGKGLETLKGDAAIAKLVADVQAAGKVVAAAGKDPAATAATLGVKAEPLAVSAEEYEDFLAPIVTAAQRGAKGRTAKDDRPAPSVALFVKRGFDERALAAVDAHLRAAGETPIVVGGETAGWIRGKDGWPVEAAGILPDVCGLSDRTLVISGEGVHPLKEGSAVWTKELSAVAAAAGKASETAGEFGAAIALREGFDEYVVAALKAQLQAAGKSVVVVGPAKGKLAGINGVAADVAAAYGDEVKLAKDAIVVVPGGLWPEKASARQAEQPAWVEEQAGRDAKRLAWVLERYKGGARLVTVGFDSVFIGRSEAFGDAKNPKVFAAPEQAGFAFGKTGGRHGGSKAAIRTDERIISVREDSVLGEGIKLMREWK